MSRKKRKGEASLHEFPTREGLFEPESLPPVDGVKRMKKLKRKRTISLRQIIRRLPDEHDLFPEYFEKKEILQAVDRVLKNDSDGRFSFWFLYKCAEEVAVHYPDISAMILERVSAMVARAPGNNSSVWQKGYIDAADYWLMAGDSEQRQDVLLKAVALTIRSSNQLNLWTGVADISLEPLWELVKEYIDGKRSEEAIGVCQAIIEHYERENFIEGVLRAKIVCSREYSHMGNWIKVKKLAEEILAVVPDLRPNSIIEFDARILLCLSLLNIRLARSIPVVLGELDEAKRILQEGTECDEEDSERLYRFLGRVWGIQCEFKLEDYVNGGEESELKEAEQAGQLCLTYLQQLSRVAISDLGNAYALLSTIYTLSGETERAAQYREKAMLLGFDLSEE